MREALQVALAATPPSKFGLKAALDDGMKLQVRAGLETYCRAWGFIEGPGPSWLRFSEGGMAGISHAHGCAAFGCACLLSHAWH